MPKTDSTRNTVGCGQIRPKLQWNQINWKQLERRVFKLQKRIFQAASRGDVRTVRRLQKTLLRSWSAKMLAVRRVTQDNQGRKTAGVDGVKSLTPKQRMNLVGQLKLTCKAKPTRRVWIPKPGKDEKRPLGIPCMSERALQALVKIALEPEWEAKFEPNSYGFRPGRGCHDAIEAIFSQLRAKAKYVLDADISKCFDKINHEKLLLKLNTFPTLRRQIRAWLKAGVMDGGKLFPTEEGTPQGGVISPLLANIALHGMEKIIKSFAEEPGKDLKKEFPLNSKRDRASSIALIRYADDFVLIHESLAVVEKGKEILETWLNELGLELKLEKTRITHTLEKHQGKVGFNFLGFNVRQYKCSRHKAMKNTRGKNLGFTLTIKPMREKVLEHYKKLRDIVDAHKAAPQAALISKLNPIIRGWSNYYSTVVSSEEKSLLDHLLYLKLNSWAKRRHPNKGVNKIMEKYWHIKQLGKWKFCTLEDGKITSQLLKHSEIHHRIHTKVKGSASPYDGDLIEWSKRMGNNPIIPTRISKLLKAQKGKCVQCGLFFKNGDKLEVDHIKPKSLGGRDEYKNWQLLHRHCHDEKTTLDGSIGDKSGCNSAKPKSQSIFPENYRWIDDLLVCSVRDKYQLIEEPDEVKVSRPVLKTSQRGDSLA
ncbi:RNA-directed DNA polymerase (Reverse transcriptase) [Gloeothece citriformis PCC 7424]|uniref:RNA-directed DNA polymerase (Reverse transcriptase) n=1 Tax=Gloeothece citriformis (strain PCC 7424) TaxID=65393 RepID=B7KE37_GLOC7|nr:group II intron reverse transcriptase/maturase [Gloeothece citriformis]ACK69423.1 RNA-directed DNA polymerase (Reverse transcriptase) [Gloeothece citriformis PCC 7424]ACK71735.1 RNA-directed DNA polymerase (Reverse transcriptase) [Gloeothece citriformis PCC 7424]